MSVMTRHDKDVMMACVVRLSGAQNEADAMVLDGVHARSSRANCLHPLVLLVWSSCLGKSTVELFHIFSHIPFSPTLLDGAHVSTCRLSQDNFQRRKAW